MSKRKRKQVSFFVGSKNKIQTIATMAYIDRKTNAGTVLVKSPYPGTALLSEHGQWGDGHGNHTFPTPYSMYAVKVDLEEFEYRTVRSSTTHYLNYGKTGLGTSDLAVPDVSKWGLVPAGALWAPSVSSDLVTRVITEAKVKLSNRDLNLVTSIAEAKEAVATMSSLLTSIAGIIAKLAKGGYQHTKVARDVYYSVSSDGTLKNQTMEQFIADNAIRKHYTRKVNALYARNAAKIANSRTGAYGPLQVPGWLPKSKRPTITGGTYKFQVFDRTPSQVWKKPNGSLVSGAENAWLSAMYGIIPIWFDFIGLSAAAHRALQKPGAEVKALRTITMDGKLPSSIFNDFSATGSYKYGAECQLVYRMADPHLNTLAALGFTNPFALWWELTPYSFVLDWLIPVGNMLEALTADAGLDFVSGYTNTKSFCDITVTRQPNSSSATGTFPKGRFRNVSQLRTIMVAAPITGLYVKSPFSAIHAISAIALLGQQLRR